MSNDETLDLIAATTGAVFLGLLFMAALKIVPWWLLLAPGAIATVVELNLKEKG